MTIKSRPHARRRGPAPDRGVDRRPRRRGGGRERRGEPTGRCRAASPVRNPDHSRQPTLRAPVSGKPQSGAVKPARQGPAARAHAPADVPRAATSRRAPRWSAVTQLAQPEELSRSLRRDGGCTRVREVLRPLFGWYSRVLTAPWFLPAQHLMRLVKVVITPCRGEAVCGGPAWPPWRLGASRSAPTPGPRAARAAGPGHLVGQALGDWQTGQSLWRPSFTTLPQPRHSSQSRARAMFARGAGALGWAPVGIRSFSSGRGLCMAKL
jgi:hypothetical protein